MSEHNEGYNDALEDEIFELEAFLHKKGLDKQLELWRNSQEKQADLLEYEKFIMHEAERIDTNNLELKDEE